ATAGPFAVWAHAGKISGAAAVAAAPAMNFRREICLLIMQSPRVSVKPAWPKCTGPRPWRADDGGLEAKRRAVLAWCSARCGDYPPQCRGIQVGGRGPGRPPHLLVPVRRRRLHSGTHRGRGATPWLPSSSLVTPIPATRPP